MAAGLRSDQLDQLLAALSQTIELYSGRKGVAKMRGRGAGTGWGGLREQRRGIREGGREKRKRGRKKYVGECMERTAPPYKNPGSATGYIRYRPPVNGQ